MCAMAPIKPFLAEAEVEGGLKEDIRNANNLVPSPSGRGLG